jgi:hypothetical protein
MDLCATTTDLSVADPPLAAFFLDRLARLVARRHTALDERQRVALACGTFSVLLDCLDLGLGAQAGAILARGHPIPLSRAPAR